MVEIPESLRTVYTATVRERDEAYVIEIPAREIEREALTPAETYRIALFESSLSPTAPTQDAARHDRRQPTDHHGPPEPPVDEGEEREVTIETIGDQGDGIAKVDGGYVVIVPNTRPGEQPTVEIDQVQESVAFASVVERDSRAR